MKKGFIKKVISIALSFAILAPYIPTLEVSASDNVQVLPGNGFNLNMTDLQLDGQGIVTMDWDDIDYTQNYSANTKYFVVRKNLATGKWQLRGNYAQETIRVLNVYPTTSGSDGFKSWMDTLNAENTNVNIQTTSVLFSNFNSNPSSYLTKGADGKYNYDVVVFGFLDSYGGGGNDISTTTSAYLAEFIEYGGGVLFGHDTVNLKGTHSNFNGLLDDYMDVVYLPQNYDANNDGTSHNREAWVYSNKIDVTRQTSSTTYPFDINEQSLVIPLSHTLGQITKSPDDILMKFEKNYYEADGSGPYFEYTGAGSSYQAYAPKDSDQIYYHGGDVGYEKGWYESNAYLLIENNVGYIQCGHTSGSTNKAEQMILANLMYAMTVLFFESKGIDQALDTVRPTMPLYTKKGDNLEFSNTDEGTEYVYRIIAMPVGYNLVDNFEGIAESLNDYNASSYDGNKIQFSKPVYTSVAPSYKNYYYTIDNKPTTNIVYDVDNDFMYTMPIEGNSLKISEIDANPKTPEIDPITDSTYMHIIATDKANNKSVINNIKLSELATVTQGTVNYVDVNGNAIADPSTDYTLKVGETFAPTKKPFIGYQYKESTPSASIVLNSDISKNVVTHVYNKLNTKNVIGVEHSKYPVVETNEAVIGNISGVENTSNTYTVPTYEKLKFSGYYTIGSPTGTIVDVNGLSALVDFSDNQPIYIHYDAIEKNAVVNIVDSITNQVIGTMSKAGHIGDTITFDFTDTAGLNLTNVNCYVDGDKLKNGTLNIELSSNDSENTKVVTLEPRGKKIVYRGYDLTHRARKLSSTVNNTSSSAIVEDNTSGSAVTEDNRNYGDVEILGTDIYTYSTADGQSKISIAEKAFEGWTVVKQGPVQIDFTNTATTVYVNYYKGNLPTEEYTYTATGIDVLSGDTIVTTDKVYLNVMETPNLDIAPINDYNSATAGRLVDYKPSEIIITNPNGVSHTYDADADVNVLLPEIDANGNPMAGDYTIKVNYVPMVQVTYDEVVLDKMNNEVTDKIIFEVPYNPTTKYTFNSTQSLEHYETKEVVLDGSAIMNPENYDFTLLADKYNKTVKITYRPLVYTISADSYLQKGDVLTKQDSLVSSNLRAFSEDTKLVAPVYDGYEYIGCDVVFNGQTATPSDYKIIETDTTVDGNATKTISFEALLEGTFVVNLIYKEKAEIKQQFVDSQGNPIISPTVDVSYVGDNAEIKFPRKVARAYSLTSVRYNGGEYTPEQLVSEFGFEYDSKTGTITMPVNKTTTNLVYIFDAKPSYEISVDGGNSVGGDISITTNVDGEIVTGPFYIGDIIDIVATPDPGYDFGHWVIIIGDIVIADINDPDTSFVMPDGSIDIGAIFVPKNDGGNGGNGGYVDNDDDDVVTPTKPEVVKPVDPPKPSTGLEGLSEYEIRRLYDPYIHGYPDLEVKPNNPITRGEVMAVIYNLFGEDRSVNLSTLNKYSDVDQSKWYSEAIAFCVENKVIGGYSDGTIRPNENITRAEICAIIARFNPTENLAQTPLSDIENSWAQNAITTLYNKGVLSGYEDGTFRPNRTATRAEFVSLTNRLIDRPEGYVKDKTYPDLKPEHWAYNDMMNASNGGIKPE